MYLSKKQRRKQKRRQDNRLFNHQERLIRMNNRQHNNNNTQFIVIIMISFFLLQLISVVNGVAEEEFHPKKKDESDASLFEPCDEIRVAAPSNFPKPTWLIDKHVVPIVEPTFGKHRKDRDAILAYAEGYKLPYYMMFVETIKDTGYTGDVVLAIAEERIIKPNVKEYLQTYALNEDEEDDDDEMHVVVYQLPLDCESRDGDTSSGGGRHVMPSGDTDVFQMCQLNHVYGWKDKDGQITGTAQDPRDGRVVATLRYEWYWIWSLQYKPESWIMLLDARDSFFQLNPFIDVPRQKHAKAGLLYLFGENAVATRLGKSKKNLRWLQNGYGEKLLKSLEDKPTICSGSTMGEQIAIETYLRAMVNEHDECDIKMTGSDQGFHNYLYYSSKLQNAETISKIIVWEQGRGAINNVGAMRIKSLEDWGIYDPTTYTVYQWDGITKSPVVHQFDRDKHLHKYMTSKRHKQWQDEWNTKDK